MGPNARADRLTQRIGWTVLAAGVPAAALAFGLGSRHAVDATAQVWPPFVLVAGLLLLGLVAGADGLFEAGGALVSRSARGGFTLLVAGAALVALIAAALNLDTAVVFLTPTVVLAARRHGRDETPFLYLVVLLANGASVLLPGSNLTNLIVLGHAGTGVSHGPDGARFAWEMLPVWLAASISIPALLALRYRRHLAGRSLAPVEWPDHRLGFGLAGVVLAVAAMVTLPAQTAAVVVMAAGLAAAAALRLQHRLTVPQIRRGVAAPVLLGLFGLAIALGTLGRSWDAPSRLLAHAANWQAAGLGAGASVLVNNLPAASLLSARPIAHPLGLLIGLDLGPNLAVTGALSAVLWLEAAHRIGARPSIWRFSRLGLVVAPVSIAAALGALAVAH